VCFIFFTHTKGQNPKPFFSFGDGWGHHLQERKMMGILAFNSIYLTTTLIVFHIHFFFINVEIFNFLFYFPASNKRILKENIEHSRKFYLVEMIFQIIYLFDKHFLKLATKVCSFFKN